MVLPLAKPPPKAQKLFFNQSFSALILSDTMLALIERKNLI